MVDCAARRNTLVGGSAAGCSLQIDTRIGIVHIPCLTVKINAGGGVLQMPKAASRIPRLTVTAKQTAPLGEPVQVRIDPTQRMGTRQSQARTILGRFVQSNRFECGELNVVNRLGLC